MISDSLRRESRVLISFRKSFLASCAEVVMVRGLGMAILWFLPLDMGWRMTVMGLIFAHALLGKNIGGGT